MTRNVRIKKTHVCPVEGCHYTIGTRMSLQNHIKTEHSIKEQLKASLSFTGWDYRFE